MNATAYQRAMIESTIGHAAVVVLAVLFVAVAGWLRPVEPAPEFVQVAIVAGPASAGELGAPSPDAKTDQDRNEAAKPPPAPKPPDPEPPKPVPPEPVKPVDPPVKEPDLPKLPDSPKVEDKPKPPDKPKVDEKPKTDDKPKPDKHQVRVQTNKIITVQNRPSPANNDKKTSQASTQLSKAQIDALLKSGLNLSKNGGAGWGGGPAGSIARGTPSGALEMYKATLKTKLYNAWARPPGVEGLMTTIRISISRGGTVIDASITRRSGNAKMDDSAMQAVQSVRPGPLPDGVDAPYRLDVEFDASGVSV